MANAIYKEMMDRMLDQPAWETDLQPIPDVSPVWIIAVLETGFKTTAIPVADLDGKINFHNVMQAYLTWAIFRPSHVLGLPFLPLQYKEWKHADDPVLVSTDDVETQGWVKTNFVDIALSFIPTDVKIQTVYQIGDLEQVIRWEQERVRQPGKGI